MKGVILSQTDAQLVDVAHDLPRQDPRAGAFWLRETLPYFPPAVHLTVVDPGVGTDRRALAVRVGDHALVGPDNGLLRPVARRLADRQSTPTVSAFEITLEEPASATFHGRDVFAPVAAEIHEIGVDRMADLDRLTPVAIEDCVDCSFPEPRVDGGMIHGEVLVVDEFGNVITNVPGELLAGVKSVTVNGLSTPVVETFAAVDRGESLVTVGSHGYVECDVNQGRGDECFGLAVGDAVEIVVTDRNKPSA